MSQPRGTKLVAIAFRVRRHARCSIRPTSSTSRCGDVDRAGIDAVAILDWPKAIHDGNGKAIFVAPPEVTEEQLGYMTQIFTGQLGGLPWSILGTTFEIAGVVRAPVEIEDDGIHSGSTIPGVGSAHRDTLKNPVTGEEHFVAIVLDTGFIWKHGDCGQGSFEVEAEGVHLKFDNSNWIFYELPRVVRLTDVAVDARHRCRVDDPCLVGLAGL